ARAAGMAVRAHVLAQQRLREGLHEVGLADAGRAVEQDRVRQPGAHQLQLVPGTLLPWINGAGHYSSRSRAAVIRARVASMLWVESITAIRCGNCAARRRYSLRHFEKKSACSC